MKKKSVFITLCILIFLIGISIPFYNHGKSFAKNKEIINAYGDIIQKQRIMDKKIEKYKNNNYTLENAKVILNPYDLCPLTALIIFNTDSEERVLVNINGKDITETEESKSHLIPIYGLYDDYDNKIKLTIKNKTVEYVISTEKFVGNKIKVEKSINKDDDWLYVMSPNFTNNTIYDNEGRLVWYILGDYAGDIEYLSNGHFYISDPYQGTNGVKINYSSFIEMDYLGKIYKQFVSDYGYHHEIVSLGNNKVLVLGTDDNSKFLESIIYIMDINTGKVEDVFDMYDVLAKIDSTWLKTFTNNFDFVLNSAQYFKDSNELLISVRGLNSVMMLDMTNKEIKWIFGDSKIYSDKFFKYILKPINKMRYPAGQHSAFISEDGLLGLHNNDFDIINNKGVKLEDYVDNYSSSNLYRFNADKRTIEMVWEYSSMEKEFSKVAGYFDILDNQNKLITYGWSIKNDAYKNVDKVTINDEKYLNGVIEEIDRNDNVIFRATLPDLIYRTYKIKSLYDKSTKNFEVYDYNKISDLNIDDEEVLTFMIGKKLANSKKFNGNVEAYINRIILTGDFMEEDSVDVILVSNKNKSYIYNYKKSEEKEKDSIRISFDNGKFALYVKINDEFFDTGKVINFD